MATVNEIYNFIDFFAPFNTQAEWDNSGLLVGDANAEVTKILFSLDCTDDVINQAIKTGANLIITHHPVIFKAVSSVLNDSLIYKLISNNINIICAHTNYDKADDGVNDLLCKEIGYNEFVKFGEFLNIIEFDKPISSNKLLNRVKKSLGGIVRFNSVNGNIDRIAVCSGSGSDFLSVAKESGCNAFLTGDASHHDFLDADEMGILLVAAGHFETENLAVLPLMKRIKNNFGVPCELAQQKTPINTI